MRCRIECLFFLALLVHTYICAEQSEEKLTKSDEMLDIEAQVSSIKTELAAVKSLAEQKRASDFNPSISVIGDVIGQYTFTAHDEDGDAHVGHDHDAGNGIAIREIELEFRADVAPSADAQIALAVHPGLKHTHLHIEEAFLRLKAWPGLDFAPLGIGIKLGILKASFGRANRLHAHHMPQISFPLAMKAFLGDEGFSAPGIGLTSSYAFSSHSAINLSAEASFAKKSPSQVDGAKEIPNGIFNIWFHQELAPFHYLDLGTSALLGRYGQKSSGIYALLGGDVHYSYLPTGYGQNPVFLLGSEIFADFYKNAPGNLGAYVWLQAKLIGSSFIGLRYDIAPHSVAEARAELEQSLGAYLGLYNTEFLRFRLGYEYLMPTLTNFDGDHRIMLGVTFVLGSHPVDPYFVNL